MKNETNPFTPFTSKQIEALVTGDTVAYVDSTGKTQELPITKVNGATLQSGAKKFRRIIRENEPVDRFGKELIGNHGQIFPLAKKSAKV